MEKLILTLSNVRILDPAQHHILLEVPFLQVSAGERIVITGESGAGKSLLLAALGNRIPAGLTMQGSRIVAPGTNPAVGFIPQRASDALHPLLRINKQLQRVSRATSAQVRKVLTESGLPQTRLQNSRPAEVSGGQAQRAAVALALLIQAPLVLADEPTSALDAETRDEILSLLSSSLDDKTALVLSTHDPAIIEALDARHLLISDGHVLESDRSTSSVFARSSQ